VIRPPRLLDNRAATAIAELMERYDVRPRRRARSRAFLGRQSAEAGDGGETDAKPRCC